MSVRCQESFASLDIAKQAQNDDWRHKLVDHEAFLCIIPAKCAPLILGSRSSDCHEEDVNTILDSWYTYITHEIERSRCFEPETSKLRSFAYSEIVFEPVKRINHSGPPKRFRARGTMWETITRRMMRHANKPAI